MSNFIYIIGKSASGKDTIYKNLQENIKTNIYVPYTTRPKREGEQHGKDYYFITKKEFIEFQNQDKVMEYRNYNTYKANGEEDIWTYATIDDEQWNAQGDFMSIGTLESYTNIFKYLQKHQEKNLNMIPVYIYIDEEERRKRALERENKQKIPNIKEMERRFKADNIDFTEEKLKKAGISSKETFQNYDLQKCIQEILEYIKSKENITKVEIQKNVQDKTIRS